MNFSESAWQSVGPWFTSILAHPFVLALGDGSLDEATFARYLVDDAHYLTVYARTLAAIASRAPDAEGIELFASSAVSAIAAETRTHAAFLTPRGIDLAAAETAEPSPTCLAYAGSLQAAAAHDSVEVAVAAILPCFRVYAEVGRVLLAQEPAADHPFRSWIDTYAAPEFDRAVRAVENYADRLAAISTNNRREKMAAAYARSTRFEWMFWDSSWRAQVWPAFG